MPRHIDANSNVGDLLSHMPHFIERLEKELEEYHQHLAKFKKGKEDTGKDIQVDQDSFILHHELMIKERA
ncbi:hypothetical protein JHK84_044905 [Glycine max]|nr:hypothetical protein JHK86_044795 [Glycine max]KAG4951544.1 hypothetical protein JHK85_045411 [Glycine max]KAG5107998.1 hypothetical protein JHK84_044905 [Glycine max]